MSAPTRILGRPSMRPGCFAAAVLAAGLPMALAADSSGSITLAVSRYLDLETGSVSGAGGDVLWNGASLVPQGRAALYNLGKYGSRAFKAIALRSASRATYGPNPIPAEALVAGDIFGVRTGAGHYAKVIVTAVNGTSLTLQFTTFLGANISPAAQPSAFMGPPPFINEVQNNYSFLLPGAPNYGIAPGSIFAIEGRNLNGNFTPVLQSSAPPGLPKTLNETSVSVTVNGVTTTPALYYASSNAVAGVLPSTTPVGNGTITVNYNGQSAQASIQVVSSAVGLDTLYGAGSGAGIVTDANFNVLTLTNSAVPGQPVILWGSGIGADTSNNDTTYPQTQNNLTNIPMQVFIGGISANILYRGRSQYPGLDQVDVVVPANVAPGCYVSVVVGAGAGVSNTVTMPVNPNGGACSDPALGLNGTQLQALASKGATPVTSLALILSESTGLNGMVSDHAMAVTASVASSEFGSGTYYASEGSCSVFQPSTGFPFEAPLDAGTIHVSGPAGSANLADEGATAFTTFTAGSVATNPGTYTFTGSGGKDIGQFTVAITLQSPFSLTNKSALASISRSQDLPITWIGGFAEGDVMVNGVSASPNGSINFYCHAPSAAGEIMIPSSILLSLAPGGGKLIVTNATNPQTVSASALDFGLATGVVSFEIPTTFR